jgi:crossover junction endodeoxyribonuclease RusA
LNKPTTSSAAIEFTIPGAAAPQGSKRAIRLRTGRTVLVESSAKVKPFRAVAALAATEAWRGPPYRECVGLEVTFRFVRPKSHYKTDGSLRVGVPLAPGKPDIDKLLRALLDALTGVIYVDDLQVACIWATKEYGARAETVVSVVI